MKPCAVCGSSAIGPAIGVQWSVDNTRIAAAVLDCGCGNTRYLAWADTPDELRHEAVVAEQMRLRLSGLA